MRFPQARPGRVPRTTARRSQGRASGTGPETTGSFRLDLVRLGFEVINNRTIWSTDADSPPDLDDKAAALQAEGSSWGGPSRSEIRDVFVPRDVCSVIKPGRFGPSDNPAMRRRAIPATPAQRSSNPSRRPQTADDHPKHGRCVFIITSGTRSGRDTKELDHGFLAGPEHRRQTSRRGHRRLPTASSSTCGGSLARHLGREARLVEGSRRSNQEEGRAVRPPKSATSSPPRSGPRRAGAVPGDGCQVGQRRVQDERAGRQVRRGFGLLRAARLRSHGPPTEVRPARARPALRYRGVGRADVRASRHRQGGLEDDRSKTTQGPRPD
jgi:hypothetical protein